MKTVILLLLASPLAFAKTYQYDCTNLAGEEKTIEIKTALLSKRVTELNGFKLKNLSAPAAAEPEFDLARFARDNQADILNRARSAQYVTYMEDRDHDDHAFDVAFLALKETAFYLYANHRSPWCGLFEGSCASEYIAFECTRR